jgi:acetyltransferase
MYCSYGNECDLSMPEILEYYGEDDGTRVIMMQTESFKDAAAFLEVASKITPHKPIFAIKAGRTREGSVAVSSHTGTLVDQAAMATAMYRKAGVVEFQDTEQMIKACVAASMQKPPRGKRIGIITNTGGPGIQAVDESIDQGLTMATWSPEGTQRLEETQYPEASIGNPVDVVATAGPDQYFNALDTLLREKDTDMVLVFFVTAPFVDLDAIAARLKEATSTSDKPVVMVVETYAEWYGLIDKLRQAGLPVYEFAEDGARALGALARYAELRDRTREDPPQLDVGRATAEAIVSRYQGKNAYLAQAEAFALLAAYGVPIPRVVEVRSRTALAEAAAKTGYPCVLKVDSAEVLHKSDEGGVALGLANEAALGNAFEEMSSRFAGARFVVMEQKKPGREVIVGATASPGLGSLVMFGLGGIFVEVMKDVMVAVAPLSRPEAREMMAGIRGHQVLTGLRGEASVDLERLEELLMRVSRLAADFPAIVEMDLNPVFAYPAGVPPAAVDVRIKIA